jgi:hypothetical protein
VLKIARDPTGTADENETVYRLSRSHRAAPDPIYWTCVHSKASSDFELPEEAGLRLCETRAGNIMGLVDGGRCASRMLSHL